MSSIDQCDRDHQGPPCLEAHSPASAVTTAGGDAAAADHDTPAAAAAASDGLPPRAPTAAGLTATREKRSRAGVNSRLADYSVELTHEPAQWADEWTPKRGRWGGRWGRGRGGRGSSWRADVHAEDKERDRCVP